MLFLDVFAEAQVFTQTLRGTVTDRDTHLPLPGATIIVLNTNPLTGTVADENGIFKLTGLPVGRYAVQASFLGYETFTREDIMLTSSREEVVHFELKESACQLAAVEVKAWSGKEKAMNSMATISARQLNIEEAARYAGGFEDPARLASVYAGSSSTMSNNGIVIRGNSPKGLSWRMEGVEISNPAHFADITTFGAGGITALSAKMLATSDFFTSAFPAEYGNALSGVFDLHLRNGNNEKYEHSFQVGTIGTDFSSEGPLGKNTMASYLFNYRYSTFSLLAPLLPADAGGVRYQDFSFKLNFPTAKRGVFSLWGIGANDASGAKAETDSMLWKYDQDREEVKAYTRNGALGVNHKLILGKKTYLHTAVAVSGNGIQYTNNRLMNDMHFLKKEDINYNSWKYTINSVLNHKFSARHSNRTGFNTDWMFYSFDIRNDPDYSGNLHPAAQSTGKSSLWSFFSQSRFDFTDRWSGTVGFHLQYFSLNGKISPEPRASLKWQINPKNSLTWGYGRHSQLELLSFYFARVPNNNGFSEPNKNLGFGLSDHLVMAYDKLITSQLHFKAEVYYQYLYHIPVIPGTSFSMLNLDKDWFFKDSLVNKGTGHNYGIDITLEHFLKDGFYYMGTLSLFNSQYRGGDFIERNTRYNRRFVVNMLAGREWRVGKNLNNLFNINARINFTGGDWISPVNETESLRLKEVIYDDTRAFSDRKPGLTYADLTISYIRNRQKHTSTWSFKLVNLLFTPNFNGYRYNYLSGKVEKDTDVTVVPNISYKIDF